MTMFCLRQLLNASYRDLLVSLTASPPPQASKATSKLRSMKRAMEEMEEENTRLSSTKRRLAREIDDLNDQVETLQREMRAKA